MCGFAWRGLYFRAGKSGFRRRKFWGFLPLDNYIGGRFSCRDCAGIKCMANTARKCFNQLFFGNEKFSAGNFHEKIITSVIPAKAGIQNVNFRKNAKFYDNFPAWSFRRKPESSVFWTPPKRAKTSGFLPNGKN